jgi:hypothetical protein
MELGALSCTMIVSTARGGQERAAEELIGGMGSERRGTVMLVWEPFERISLQPWL